VGYGSGRLAGLLRADAGVTGEMLADARGHIFVIGNSPSSRETGTWRDLPFKTQAVPAYERSLSFARSHRECRHGRRTGPSSPVAKGPVEKGFSSNTTLAKIARIRAGFCRLGDAGGLVEPRPNLPE
jgi:hypothetical protein